MKMRGELILGLVLTAGLAMGCGSGKKAQEAFTEDDGVFAYKVGQFEVYTLVDAQREGSAEILVGVDDELLQQYIPESGFMHSTNAFLIKTPEQNILVDTAFGGSIFEKAQKLGVEPEQIDTVLITHLHGDHFSGLQKDGEATLPNAKIYLAAGEYTYFTETQVNEAAVAALALYEVITFEPAELGSTLVEIIPGISPIAAYGHTPGHTIYMVENSGSQLIIAGDFLHVGLVQFALPNISATYDMDKAAAAAVREQILDYAAQNKIPVGGMHIVYPGVGTVTANDEGGFSFAPLK